MFVLQKTISYKGSIQIFTQEETQQVDLHLNLLNRAGTVKGSVMRRKTADWPEPELSVFGAVDWVTAAQAAQDQLTIEQLH